MTRSVSDILPETELEAAGWRVCASQHSSNIWIRSYSLAGSSNFVVLLAKAAPCFMDKWKFSLIYCCQPGRTLSITSHAWECVCIVSKNLLGCWSLQLCCGSWAWYFHLFLLYDTLMWETRATQGLRESAIHTYLQEQIRKIYQVVECNNKKQSQHQKLVQDILRLILLMPFLLHFLFMGHMNLWFSRTILYVSMLINIMLFRFLVCSLLLHNCILL